MEVAAGHRTDQPRMGFAKTLASPSAKTREKAISLLVLWLTSQKDLKEDELKKIWKGLFYCVWHSDKAPVQADLIERLTSLAEKLEIGLSLQFFKVFLSTMRREWAGIDRLRMDKFYLLLRRYLAHMFLALEKAEWDAEIIKEFMDALLERTFLAKDQYAALGINLHYADVFLQELEKFLPLRVETFRLLMEPFLVVLANASDKSFLERVKDNIFGRLFDLSRTVIFAKQEGSALETSAELLGSLALSLPLASEVFRLASMPSTLQANRRRLYELHKEFEVLEKLLTNGSAVVKNQHLLLCTLLVCNSLAMEALPIFLDSLVSAWAAVIISVTLILMFGEILPQAVCTRYGLAIGAIMTPVARILVVVCFPITYHMMKPQ